MRSHADIISNHRLRRYFTWARLCLLRVAAMLAEQSGLCAILPRWLRRRLQDDVAILAQIAAMIIFLSACKRVAPKRKPRTMRPAPAPRGYKPRVRGTAWRGVVGSKLRRSLRGKTLGVRITAILDVLRDPEPHIAAFARRLDRGFHRCGGVLLTQAPGPAPIRAPRLAALVAADTS